MQPCGTIEENQKAFDFNALFCLTCGIALTLIVSGYQFGRGNHTVYLLDGLRELHPELLRNDWFVTHTLQYHAVFSALTAGLMKLHCVQPAFLGGYLLLVVLWHFAWRGMVRAIGADDRTYLLAVVLFYISAGGISIGVFQFLQDACFLPSNVANIAMLWGIYRWMLGRPVQSGIWFGIAGLFHVNFAAMTIGLWTVLITWTWFDRRRDAGPPVHRDPMLWWATAAAFIPSLFNLAMTVPDELRHGGTMPMKEFVRVYVRFRHAHHFDPLHWSIALWISFLWPIPIAILAMNSRTTENISLISNAVRTARREASLVFVVILALLIIAFLFAGVWFLNEPLVQLCLWRFSIFIKMFSCIGAAWFAVSRLSSASGRWVVPALTAAFAIGVGGFWTFHQKFQGMAGQTVWAHRDSLLLILTILAVISIDALWGLQRDRRVFRWPAVVGLLVLLAGEWPALGVGMTPEPEDPNYRQVCAWARQSTPIDAIFLVPPQETDFRLYAQRAIIVNFKHVPQLSGEIVQWRQRLLDVLGLHDVAQLPQEYTRTMDAISSTYESRPAEALIAVSAQYGASYIVVDHPLDSAKLSLAFHLAANPFFVYQISTEKNSS